MSVVDKPLWDSLPWELRKKMRTNCLPSLTTNVRRTNTAYLLGMIEVYTLCGVITRDQRTRANALAVEIEQLDYVRVAVVDLARAESALS